MNSHHGFSDSDDEITGSYRCSDPDHCDRGVYCDGDHTYSRQYLRLRGERSEVSEVKSELTVDGKPESASHAVVVDDCDGDDDSGDADGIDLHSDSGEDDPNSDPGDDEPNSDDSDDACSCS